MKKAKRSARDGFDSDDEEPGHKTMRVISSTIK